MKGDLIKRSVGMVPVRIILPVILTVVLFALTLFFLMLPRFEAGLMERKREMIRELTETAWRTLAFYRDREVRGELSGQEARRLAREHLRSLRYGPEKKDYYWINDMHPRLVMHPYRPELEGRDISGFADPNGKHLFMAFVETVRKGGEGFVDYQWQWKDDPGRIVPKISYVKGFAPWGWIVGTGIYVEDVRAEIADITRRLSFISLGILVVILALSLYIIRQGVRAKRERQRAEALARDQREQLFHAAKMVSIGTLVSGVAHEINNPVTFITLNTPILERAWDGVLPVLDEYHRHHGDVEPGGLPYPLLRERMPRLISDISDGAKRVKNLVADLKDFARQGPPEMTDQVDVNRIVEKAVGLVENLIRKSTDRFSAEPAPDPPRFPGNAQKIEQVVINLLVNACQALTDRDQPITVRTAYDAAEGRVAIEVRDGGRGIPPDVADRITDPFFTTRRDDGGTGLGLAISDRIIRDHGGTLAFSSQPGMGTTARISLSVSPDPDGGEARP